MSDTPDTPQQPNTAPDQSAQPAATSTPNAAITPNAPVTTTADQVQPDPSAAGNAISYVDDAGKKQEYVLQAGESYDEVSGLVQPSGVTLQVAAQAAAVQAAADLANQEENQNGQQQDNSGTTGAPAGDASQPAADPAAGTGSDGTPSTPAPSDNSQQPDSGGDTEDAGGDQVPPDVSGLPCGASTVNDLTAWLDTLDEVTYVITDGGLVNIDQPSYVAALELDPELQELVDNGTLIVTEPTDTSNAAVTPMPSVTASLDEILAWFDAQGINYKQTESAEIGTVGFPVWIEQSDYDALVQLNPALFDLVNAESVGITSVPLTQFDPSDNQNSAGGETPASGDNNGTSGTQTPANGTDTPLPESGGGNGDGDAVDPAVAGGAATDDSPAEQPGSAETGTVDQSGSASTQGTDPDQAAGTAADAAGTQPAPEVDPSAGQTQDPAQGTQDVQTPANASSVIPGDATDPTNPASTPVDQGSTSGSDVPVAPVPVPAKPGQGDGGRALTDTSINQIVRELIKDVSDAGRNVIESIYQYIEKMRPNMPITPQEGARHQAGLYRTMSAMFNRLDGDFDPVYRAALKLVEAHSKGVFADTHKNRFMESVALTENERKAFQRLMTLMTITAPVQGRDTALKQIDLNAALKHGVTEGGRARVFGFYGK